MKNEISRNRDLPPELLLRIFRILAFSGYARTLAFKRSSERFGEDILRKLIESQRDLYHGTLVCWDWYPSGVELLYMCPYILSSEQLRLLRRTLANKPDLLSWVKSAVMADIQYPDSSLQGSQDPQVSLVPKDFTFLLSSCTSLTELALFPTPNSTSSIVRHPTILPCSSIPTRYLTRINFFGPGLYNLTPHHTFDSLEVLSISTNLVKHPFTFPGAPKLHTLQLVKAFMGRTEGTVETEGFGDCKTLRTLELYMNTPSRVMEFLPLRRPQLERLHLIGHTESIHFESWSTTGSQVPITATT